MMMTNAACTSATPDDAPTLCCEGVASIQLFVVHMTPELVCDDAASPDSLRLPPPPPPVSPPPSTLWTDTVQLLPDGPAKSRIVQHLHGDTADERLRGKSALLWRVAGHLSAERLREYGTPFLYNAHQAQSRPGEDDDSPPLRDAAITQQSTPPPEFAPPLSLAQRVAVPRSNPPSWLSKPYHLGRTMEGRPYFVGYPHADVSVSHSGSVSAYATIMVVPRALEGNSLSLSSAAVCGAPVARSSPPQQEESSVPWRRVGVDIEEVERFPYFKPNAAAGASAPPTSTPSAFMTFITNRARRLLPNFSMGELWWLLTSTTSAYRADHRSALLKGVAPGSVRRPFSAVPPHSSISGALFAEAMHRQLLCTDEECVDDASQRGNDTTPAAAAARPPPCARYLWYYILQWRLYLLWTVKEAYVKALGHGIPFGMHRIVLRPAGDDWGPVDDVLSRALCCDPHGLVGGCGMETKTLRGARLYVDGVCQEHVDVAIFATVACSPCGQGESAANASVGALVTTPADDKFLVDGVRVVGCVGGSATKAARHANLEASVYPSHAFLHDVLQVVEHT